MTSGQPGPLLLVTALAWVAWATPASAVTIFSDSGADAASICAPVRRSGGRSTLALGAYDVIDYIGATLHRP